MGLLDWITRKRTRTQTVPPLTVPPRGLVVVKVGGSLYDHRHLRMGLREFLDGLEAPKILLVAGGGEFANYVRELDAWHNLGEEVCHYLALQSHEIGKTFLIELLDPPNNSHTMFLEWWNKPERLVLLDGGNYLFEYEMRYGRVPHTWELTTDSIAAYAAAVANAKLILLKSVDIPPETPWTTAAERGWVDAHFPSVVAKHNLTVEAIHFRRWLDERTPLDDPRLQ